MKNNALKEEGNVAIEVEGRNQAAAARSALYGTFSHLFSYPDGENTKDHLGEDGDVNSLRLIEGLPYEIGGLGKGLADLLEAFRSGFDQLQDQYTGYFDNCTGSASVSLREADYTTRDPKEMWEELVRFYEHFGLDYNLERVRLWPDHLTVQLDALQYLAFIEALAEDSRLPLVRAQMDFLDNHLLKWIGPFSDCIGNAEDNGGLYGRASVLLVHFLKKEKEYLEGSLVTP